MLSVVRYLSNVKGFEDFFCDYNLQMTLWFGEVSLPAVADLVNGLYMRCWESYFMLKLDEKLIVIYVD